MKRLNHLLILSSLTLALACGGEKKAAEGDTGASDLKEAGERAAEAVDESAKRQAARRERGDTVAMPYKQLETYLPEVDGYAKQGGPRGSQMNIPGAGTWSQTEQDYESGEKTVKVSVFDYNGSSTAFLGATAMLTMGFSQEDDQKRSGNTDLGVPGTIAYETVYKQEKRAELFIVVADRFLIQMDADGSNDVELLKSAARGMKLEDLAKR